MNQVINLARLNIFRNYHGDLERLLRTGSKPDLDAFTFEIDDSWAKMTSFTQDIELIEKGLVSTEFADRTIINLKLVCDTPAFDELTKTIRR